MWAEAVHCRRTIQRQARIAAEAAVHCGIRIVHVDGGTPARAAPLVWIDRPQLDVAPPQGAQVKRQAAFDVGEHGLVAFRLQQLTAFFAVQREIAGLRVRVAHVRLHAEQCPAPQAIEGQLFEKADRGAAGSGR